MSADTDFVYSSHFPESIADLSHRSNRLGVVRSRPANVYPLARFGLTLLLYTMPALLAMRGAMMADPDVWWHLRTAEWITEHHAVPRTDPFTTFGAGHPWAAYSWLFELLLLGLFRSFGLYGIVLYTSTMLLLITVAVHRLVRESLGDTPVGVMLTFLVCFSMGHLYTPRPWLFTILLFVVELRAVWRFRATRNLRAIIVLPAVFALWANVHIQFIDGLALLVLACADEAWTAFRLRTVSFRSTYQLCGITSLCFAATLVNPYGPHIYKVAHDLTTQPGVLNSLQELQAIPFRDVVDWTVLALAAASTVALAREKRPSLFKSFLLTFAVVLAFRSQRDVWILCVVSAAVLSCHKASTDRRGTELRSRSYDALLVGSAFLTILSGSFCLGITNGHLQERLNAVMPASASAYLQRAGYRGPLFNDYTWGGYLIWRLHQPVCIDGRASFQGDERISRSIATWNGATSWIRDPDLLSSNLVIGQRNAPLSQLLRQSPEFRLLYEDQIASVFARRSQNYRETR